MFGMSAQPSFVYLLSHGPVLIFFKVLVSQLQPSLRPQKYPLPIISKPVGHFLLLSTSTTSLNGFLSQSSTAESRYLESQRFRTWDR